MGDDRPDSIQLTEVWHKEDAPDLNCWVCMGEHCDYTITRYRMGGRTTNGAHGRCLQEMLAQAYRRANLTDARPVKTGG